MPAKSSAKLGDLTPTTDEGQRTE